MNKSELIEAIAERSGVTKAAVSRVFEGFIGTVMDTLKSGKQIVIPGFGTLSVGVRAARTGRNPQTGAPIQIKAARVPKFRAGKSLKEAVSEEAVEV